MKTKINILAATLALAVVLGSCDKQEKTSATAAIEDIETVTLRVSVSDSGTKSTDDWSDDEVSNLSVYVFDADGTVSGYGYVENATSLEIECTTGSGKGIYAVANLALGEVSTLSELTAKTSGLDDNETGAFVMTGYLTDQEILTSQGVDIEIYRAAAKVSVDKIVNSISDGSYLDQTFTLTGMYLVNVPVDGLGLFSRSYSDDYPTWANKMAYTTSIYDDYLYDSINEEVTEDSPYETSHTFYCYPNLTESDTSDEEWCARKTRLVIEAMLGSDTYYYPITLDEVAYNTHYHFSSITIMLRGSSSPDYPISSDNIGFSVSVQGWDTEELEDLTI